MNGAGFTGKVALVTGGGTGIGAGIAAWFADRGAAVVIGQPDQGRADAAVLRLSGPGLLLSGVGADLSTAAGCRAAVEQTLHRHGRIDILVNNAAVTGPPAVAPFLEFGDEHLDTVVDVNLKAAFRCARWAARDMVSRRSGVIVNISSVGAYAAQLGASAYVATKAGLVGLTKGLALELAGSGVRVVGVAPGDIDTESPAGSAAQVKPDWWQRYTPVGRRGTPADIAAAVGFLCRDEASFITGETLVVDGGWLAY
jgi:3-oxoacyl-[acyl-carrier protein] reductase